MEKLWIEALQSYGVFGFVIIAIVIGGTAFVNRITNYFINAIQKRDAALEDMSSKFFKTMSEYSKKLELLYERQGEISADVKEVKLRVSVNATQRGIR